MPALKHGILLFSAVAAGVAVVAACGVQSGESKAVYAATSGVVRIHHMGGDIDVPDAPDGADVSTMGGAIHVGKASFVNAKTMGGDIVIDSATGPVDASTMGGKVTVRQATGSVHAGTMGGDVRANLIGSSNLPRDVKLTSMGGSIRLTVPKDFGMEVHIKLTYTKNSPQNYRIIQHLGLSESESPDWDQRSGTPQKYIVATGRVGDGRNKVTIETVNGDVVLEQE